MNWYRIIKTAAAINKIKSLNINDRFYQAFIYKYEGIIPWNLIKTYNDFITHVKGIRNNLETRADNVENPDSQKVLENWFNLIDKWYGNTNHARTCLVMIPVVEWAENHRAAPMIVMPDVVKEIVNSIAENPSKPINFLRTYKTKAASSVIERTDGWHKFERGSNQMSLYLFTQGAGWCLSTGEHAGSYLQSNDIYIYVEDKKPVAAVVVNPEYNYIYEVRAQLNRLPFKYRNLINQKVKENKWETNRSSTYLAMENTCLANQEFERDPNSELTFNFLQESHVQDYTNMQYYEGVSEKLKKNPNFISWISDKLREKLRRDWSSIKSYSEICPELRKDHGKVIADYFGNEVEKGEAVNITDFPPILMSSINMQKLIENWQRFYDEGDTSIMSIPSVILAHFSNERIAKGISNSLFSDYFTKFKNKIGAERLADIIRNNIPLFTEGFIRYARGYSLISSRKIISHLDELGNDITKLILNGAKEGIIRLIDNRVYSLALELRWYLEKYGTRYLEAANMSDRTLEIPKEFSDIDINAIIEKNDKIISNNMRNNWGDEVYNKFKDIRLKDFIIVKTV